MLSLPDARELMSRAVFRLRIEKNQQSGSWEWGTAFFVEDRIALTAYHNLSSARDPRTLRGYHEGTWFDLTCSMAYSLPQAKGDIAVLEVVGAIPEGTTPLRLGVPGQVSRRDRVHFFAGRSVCAFGFPFEHGSQESRLVPGMIDSAQPLVERDWKEQYGTSDPGIAGLTEWLRIHTDDNATQLPGISGAPILDLHSELVIGVQHSYIPRSKIIYGTELMPLAQIWPSFRKLARAIDLNVSAFTSNDTAAELRPKTPQSVHARGLLPMPPRMLVGRRDVLDEIRRRLTSVQSTDEPGQRVLVVHGVPGVGKTSVVSALAHDAQLRASFPDGVLWTSLGQNPNTNAVLEDWLNALTGTNVQPGRSISSLQGQLAAILSTQRVLLIIDDVWEASDADLLRLGGVCCGTLITTRETEAAISLAQGLENIYKLAGLSTEKAIELLIKLASWVVAQYPEEAYGLVEDFTGLPLAIHVAAQLLNSEVTYGLSGMTVPGLLEQIRNGAELLKAKPPHDRGVLANETGVESVAVLLELSTNRLSEDDRMRFALLGAVAEKPAVFEEGLMQALWDCSDPKPTIKRLVDRGLLQRARTVDELFEMHRLLVLHARELAAKLSP